MKLIICGICLLCLNIATNACAIPITYIAEGIAGYETATVGADGTIHSSYQETSLWGYVTFDDQVESHTSMGEWYYTYSILDFHVETSQEIWSGNSSKLTWESGYGNDEVAFRDVWMSNFINPNSSNFYFLENDGSTTYSFVNVNDWLTLPAEVAIWSDSLAGADADYVSFSLYAPDPPLPVPEPSTAILCGIGLVGLTGIRRRQFLRCENRKLQAM